MIGYYLFGLPFVSLPLQSNIIECLIDTGFNGTLMLPMNDVNKSWRKTGRAQYMMADGELGEADIYAIEFEWFDQKKQIQVLVVNCDFPLLGMALLKDSQLLMSPSESILEISTV